MVTHAPTGYLFKGCSIFFMRFLPLRMQEIMAAQAAYKIEDFKQPCFTYSNKRYKKRHVQKTNEKI